MHSITLDLLGQNGQELHRNPPAKVGHIQGLSSKANHLLKEGLQAVKGYCQGETRQSSRTIEIYFLFKNSQLQQTRSPYDDLKTVAKWK